MSLTSPTMTWELEQACHCLSRYVLIPHLNQKYGENGWSHAGIGFPTSVVDGVTRLNGTDLGRNAVEAGLIELRRQLAEHDERHPPALLAAE